MKKKLTPQDLDARLKFVVGCVLAGVLTITTIGVLYALVFVTQPIGAQAENDKMFFGVLSSVATFITGTLAGLMISTGRNAEDKNCAEIITSNREVSFTGAIRKLANDVKLREELGMNGYKEIVNNYSKEVVVSNYASLLNSL